MKSIIALVVGLLIVNVQGADITIDVKEPIVAKQQASAKKKSITAFIKLHTRDTCQLWSKSYTGGTVAAARCPSHDQLFTNDSTECVAAVYASDGRFLTKQALSKVEASQYFPRILLDLRKSFIKPLVTHIVIDEKSKKLSLYCYNEMLVSLLYRGSTLLSEIHNLKSDFIIGPAIARVSE